MAKKRVAIIGSGNWGCAIAKIVGMNCARVNHLEEEVSITRDSQGEGRSSR